jgi:vancomycin resistance protein YoaR
LAPEPLPKLLSKFLRLLGFLAAVSVVATVGLVAYDYFQSREKFPPQTFVGKVNVAGLDQARAFEKLNQLKVSDVFTLQITFEVENYRFSFSPEAAGIFINNEETVKRAFEITHQEGYLKELKERLKKGPVICPLVFAVNEKPLNDLIEAIASEVRSTAKNASIQLFEETGGYHIESEELGREVNVGKTVEDFKKRLAQGEKVFPLIIDYEFPRISEKALRASPPAYRLSAYTTYYGRHDSPNRIHNIKLMASWLDGTLLMPNDEFSLVEAIGDFTTERGFKEAFVIYGGVLTPMLGGGGCQIGTTLYNVVALADLEIIQRQNHSFYFNIYPLGRDATIYPGQKDLGFKNNTGRPLLIKAIATNKRLSFRVYGTPTGKKVEFSAPAVYLLTASGYRSATVSEVLAADRPFKTNVLRTVYDAAGNKIREELLQSYYKLYGEKTNVPISRPEPR